ncbi:transmembrane protein 26 isoform X2 [Choristoneura fumiferana]|uniref:transmembrane protein 26 isoform X2 n=1 Tax=Choristoneura fumiferana TaxID=7141 RepID=UPI003D15A4C2
MTNVGKVLATIKAVITRLVFACHGIIAIWQVNFLKDDITYWYLASPILLLIFEGVFTLTIKENQEWKWFCPSVFLYLVLVVPAIWLLELHKVDMRVQQQHQNSSDQLAASAITTISPQTEISFVGATKLPTDMWVTLIEQFLMLTLIVGRWLLPKGDLTRDQLSQLLLVYIGTAADIIEFFDSFKDEKVASEKVLVLLTLAIWSWSLVQFTVVLTATKSRKSRGTANRNSRACCCSIEVCAIMMNIVLQDAPFLAFRLLIIAHYKIINYMNIFFTCKNTLVILLQLYRLYVLHLETVDDGTGGSVYRKRKHKSGEKKKEKKDRKDKDKKHKNHHKSGKHKKHEETCISVITDRRQERVEGGRIRAIILTNSDEIEELELSKLFKDQVSLEHEKRRGAKKKQKSESSEESLNNIQHTTDDSGI